MGSYGFNAPLFFLIRIVIPAGFCIIFHWLGHRAGYKNGSLICINNGIKIAQLNGIFWRSSKVA